MLNPLADGAAHTLTDGGGHWTLAHWRWLARQSFEHTAQQIVFQEKVDAITNAPQRLHRLDEQLAAIVPSWSVAPVLEARQAMRDATFLVAVTFVAFGPRPAHGGVPESRDRPM